MSEGSNLVHSFINTVESISGSAFSSSLSTKLKVGSVILGEGADVIEEVLKDRIPNLPAIISAGEKLVADAEQLEKDTEAFYTLVKSTFSSQKGATNTTEQPAQ